MKLQTLIALGLTSTVVGCANLGYHNYNQHTAIHQNIQAASMLKMGMSADEAKQVMGDKPIRLDTEGGTTVWQYCNTQRNKSDYVALFFSAKSNLLEKLNYYTIFWEETKGKHQFHDFVVDTSDYQLSCDRVAQNMGIKNPNEIKVWFNNDDALLLLNQRDARQNEGNSYDGAAAQRGQQEQQMRQIEQNNRVNGR